MKAFLSLRANGIWYIVERTSDGKNKRTSTGTKDRHKAERQLLVYTPSERRETDFFITQFAQVFHDHQASSLADTTLRLYTDAFTALIETVGNVSIDLLTAREVDLYKATRARKVKPITVNKELATLKAAFNHAVRWGYIETNPFIGIRRLRVQEKMPVYFTRDELRLLIDGVGKDWLHDIIVVAVATGMRQGEILQLQWHNVDMNRRSVRIVSGERFRTKTGKFRVVPLNEDAMTVVNRRRQLREAFVFTQDGQPIKQDWLTHAFKKSIRRLGLREELHFHSLRHTFASWLVQDGVSLYQVGRLLGHTDTKTTEIYAHLQPETMHDVVDRIRL